MEEEINLNNEWVRETRFGRWFLSTDTWVRYVLLEAVQDFSSLLVGQNTKVAKILDAGCGQGLAFSLLEKQFSPDSIIGIDVDAELLAIAGEAAESCACRVSVSNASASNTGIESGSIDMIFCHQLLHHTANQEAILREFKRVLAPDGVLLIGESCHKFIRSLPVRLLFKHPKQTQKDAKGYIDLVKNAGFVVDQKDIQTTTPWWSRMDLGLLEKWGLSKKSPIPTEVLIVARK